MPMYSIVREETFTNTVLYYVDAATEEDAIAMLEDGEHHDSEVLEVEYVEDRILDASIAPAE
jgi:hypothetical protein